MPEPGVAEGQAPKPAGGEPFPRTTGDIPSFSTAEEHLKSLVDQAKEETKPPFQRETGKDLPSFAEANANTQELLAREAYQNGDLEGFIKHTNDIASPVSPELQKIIDEIGAGIQAKTDEAGGFDKGWRNKVLQPLKYIAERFKLRESGEPFSRRTESDLPSFAEANNRFAEILRTPSQELTKEFNDVSEGVDRQAGAVGLVEGFMDWVKTTGDTKTMKLLKGNIANIVGRFAKNPAKASEIVEALTEEEAQKVTRKAEEAGIIRTERKIPDAKTTPPLSAQTQTPTT